MALSGTLETFSLPDVLRLLASTKKTGLLTLEGDRGVGRVWVAEGAITAADSDRGAGEIDGVVFDLLRFVDGSFEFEPGVDASERDGDAHDVESALASAESLLEEWREIESVVPSLDVWVRLVEDVDDDVVVSPSQWRVLARIGTGTSGHRIAGQLAQGELDVCRQLRDLIDGGLVELDDEPEVGHADVTTEVVPASGESAKAEPFTPPAFAASTIGSAEWTPPTPLGPDAVTEDPWGGEPESMPERRDRARGRTRPRHGRPGRRRATDDARPSQDDATDADDDADGFLSQLAHLSPKAAAAIEATAGDDAEPVDDVDAAVDADASGHDDFVSSLLPRADDRPDDRPDEAASVDSDDIDPTTTDVPGDAMDDGELNQNLLLRFLSSAKQ